MPVVSKMARTTLTPGGLGSLAFTWRRSCVDAALQPDVSLTACRVPQTASRPGWSRSICQPAGRSRSVRARLLS